MNELRECILISEKFSLGKYKQMSVDIITSNTLENNRGFIEVTFKFNRLDL